MKKEERQKNVPMRISTSSRSDGNVQHAISKMKARATIDFNHEKHRVAVQKTRFCPVIENPGRRGARNRELSGKDPEKHRVGGRTKNENIDFPQ